MRVVFLLLLLVCQSVSADELKIASAANFYHTLEKIKTEFEKKSEHRVTIIRGSTGKLYAQIMHGAPFDLFLSADIARADKLIEEAKSVDGFARVYARGQLVLWSPGGESAEAIRQKLISGQFNKLSIANPKTAPYGKAAIDTLESLQLMKQLKGKIVYAENIAQAVQYVESGAADLGLVARSLVNDKTYWSIEEENHTPIEQKMLILKRTEHLSAAKAFYEFMQSEQVLELIRKDGYSI